MKKRIFSLVLAMVMLLSLVLVSCNDSEESSSSSSEESSQPTVTTPVGEVVPTESIFGKFEVEQQDKTTITLSEKVTFAGNEYSYVGSASYREIYRKANYNSDNTAIISYDYVVLFLESSKTVTFTKPVLAGDESNDTLATMLTEYNIGTIDLFGEDYIYISLGYGASGEREYDISVYDLDGNLIFTAEDMEYPTLETYYVKTYYRYSNGSSNFLYVTGDNILYRWDENEETGAVTATKVADLEEASVPLNYLRRLNYDKTADQYYLANEEGITVFNKNLTLTNIIKYDRIVGSDIEIYTLENGSKYIVETYMVPDDVTDYTYQESGSKYVVRTSIYSAEKGLVKVDAIGYIGYVYSISSIGLKTSDTTIQNLMVNASKITEDKTLVSTKDYIVLDNDGKVVKILETSLDLSVLNMEKLPNGAIIAGNGYEYYIVDSNGNKIATLPTMSKATNNKWVVTSKYVYDATGTIIYNIPESREIERVLPDSIVFTEEYRDEAQNLVRKRILWTGVDSEKVISETDNESLFSINNYCYAVKTLTENNTYNVHVYDSTGAELLSAVNTDSFYIYSNYITYSVTNESTNETTYVYISINTNN